MFQYDFYIHYAAGALALQGADCYDPRLLSSVAVPLGFFNDEAVPFPYPPYALWLYGLLAMLPFTSAQTVWALVNAAAAGASVVLCSKLIFDRDEEWKGLPPRHIVFALIAFFPLTKALWYGQAVPLILGSSMLGLLQCERKRSFFGGALLSVALIKPHISVPILSAIFLLLPREERRTFAAGAALGFAAQVAASAAVFPSVFSFYWSWLFRYAQIIASWDMPSPVHLLSKAAGMPYLAAVLWLAGWTGVIVVSLRVRRLLSMPAAVLLVITPLAVVASPYLWTHDFLLLLAPYLAMASTLLARPGRGMTLLLLFFAGFITGFYDPHDEYLLFWVPILLAAQGALAIQRFKVQDPPSPGERAGVPPPPPAPL